MPDEDLLYYRVHRDFFTGNVPRNDTYIPPGAFRDREGAMSTDWSKYATPDEAQQRARVPEDNGVVCLSVGAVREEAKQRVQHSPLEHNRAHTDVIGDKGKGTRARLVLTRIARWEIPVTFAKSGRST